MKIELKACPAQRPPPTPVRGRKELSRAADKEVCVALVFSHDESLMRVIGDGLGAAWMVNRCVDPTRLRAVLAKRGTKIVVVDDSAIEETTRGWVLDQIRRWAPQALVAYLASNHTTETERRARSHRVHYYVAKPLDHDRIVSVLRAFAKAVGLTV